MDSIATEILLSTAHLGVLYLHTAQMGTTMQSMDSMKYSATVARRVGKALSRARFSISEASEKSGIPRVTLTRRLKYPASSPFTVRELHQISEVVGCDVSDFFVKEKKSEFVKRSPTEAIEEQNQALADALENATANNANSKEEN